MIAALGRDHSEEYREEGEEKKERKEEQHGWRMKIYIFRQLSIFALLFPARAGREGKGEKALFPCSTCHCPNTARLEGGEKEFSARSYHICETVSRRGGKERRKGKDFVAVFLTESLFSCSEGGGGGERGGGREKKGGKKKKR